MKEIGKARRGGFYQFNAHLFICLLPLDLKKDYDECGILFPDFRKLLIRSMMHQTSFHMVYINIQSTIKIFKIY